MIDKANSGEESGEKKESLADASGVFELNLSHSNAVLRRMSVIEGENPTPEEKAGLPEKLATEKRFSFNPESGMIAFSGQQLIDLFSPVTIDAKSLQDISAMLFGLEQQARTVATVLGDPNDIDFFLGTYPLDDTRRGLYLKRLFKKTKEALRIDKLSRPLLTEALALDGAVKQFLESNPEMPEMNDMRNAYTRLQNEQEKLAEIIPEITDQIKEVMKRLMTRAASEIPENDKAEIEAELQDLEK